MLGGHPRRRLGIHSAPLLIGFLTLVAALLGSMNGLGRFDQAFYDRAVIAAERPASDDILLVTIDGRTVEALGRGPWSRAVHATLLGRLQNARAVGLDFRLNEHDAIDPDGDAALAEAIRANGRVVLPVALNPLPRPASLEPALPPLASAAAALGFTNVPPDTDGVIRQAVWRTTLNERHWQHMALAMLQAGGEANLAQALTPQGLVLISPAVFTGISGGHLVEWYPHTLKADMERRSEPWEHLRQRRFTADCFLNEMRLHEYHQLFERHFTVMAVHNLQAGHGRSFLTEDVREELADYGVEELLGDKWRFVLRKKKGEPT